MRRIAPFHALTLTFLIGLIILTLFFRAQIPVWQSLILFYGLLLGILVLISTLEQKRVGRPGKFFHDFSPILFVILIYQSLGELIQHLRPDIDPWLIRIDFSLFGVHPTVWMERWVIPWFTDVMSFAYGSYYFLPVILIATLYLKDRRKLFDTSMFVLVFGYYISFIGYILFPAIGPRYTLTHLYSVPLEGSILTDVVRDGLNALEHNKRDVMPSGHTQIALMVLYLAYRYERILFYPFLPLIAGLIVSTIYLRYHYVVDLMAGVVIAAGCLAIGFRIHAWWNRLQEARQGCSID